MKKLLILILIALLAGLSVYTFVQGISIGSIEILGIRGIDAKNASLDQRIQEAGKLAEKDYVQAINTVTTDTKKLKEEKKNYEDMTAISEDSEIQAANQIEKYENETLMVKLGNHATKQGAEAKIVYETGAAQGIYNIKFTVTGRYISILDFISAIENDSTLGFKIENFNMKPSSSGETLEANFTCRGIAIEKINTTVTNNQNPTTEVDGQMDMNNPNNPTNATNTTNTNNTNTTNNKANTNTSNTNVAR